MPVQDPNYPVKVTVTFARVYGAILLATIIGLCIYGVGLLMVLQYFKGHAGHDPKVVKVTIVILCLLATFQTAFSCHQVYDTFIIKLGNWDALDAIGFSVVGRWYCVYLAAFFAQVFFCSRIWIVGRSMNTWARYLSLPALVFALLQLGAGLAQASTMAISKRHSILTMKTRSLITMTAIQGGGSSLSDLIISGTLCYIFLSHRTAIKRTNTMINGLVTYAINRAIATTFCAVSSVLLYYFASGTYYFLIPLFASTNLYLISAVSMLTSREGLRASADPSFRISHLGIRTELADDSANVTNSDSSGNTASELVFEKNESESRP